jgi:uncharacterized protein DUF2795
MAMPALNPDDKTALELALRELDYPAPRNKVLEMAKMNDAPRRVLEAIMELPETADFHDRSQLHDALGIDVPGMKPTGGWE